MDKPDAGRRGFLKLSALAGGGFMLGFTFRASAASLAGAAKSDPDADEVAVTAWVRVTSDNQVTLIVSQAEIGQGIGTTLPAILADELGADWSRVDWKPRRSRVRQRLIVTPSSTGCSPATARASRAFTT